MATPHAEPPTTSCQKPGEADLRPQATRPVPTPARAACQVDADNVPVHGDETAEKPKAGQLRLSENAVNLRLLRVLKPNPKTGEFRVSEKIRTMYGDKRGKGRGKLLQIFQSCGFDPDRGVSKQHKTTTNPSKII